MYGSIPKQRADGSLYSPNQYQPPMATPVTHANAATPSSTASILRERIRAQEASIRQLRQQRSADMTTTPQPPTPTASTTNTEYSQNIDHAPSESQATPLRTIPPAPVVPPSPSASLPTNPPPSATQEPARPITPKVSHGGVFIPPLRLPTQPPPQQQPLTTASVVSPKSSTRSPLPQSNESATYFDQGSDVALIMRVRLDTGVHELEVPHGVQAQELATQFAQKHGLKPQQVQLLTQAIASHLDLLEQYQSVVASQQQSTLSTWRSDRADAPPDTQPPAPHQPPARIEEAKETLPESYTPSVPPSASSSWNDHDLATTQVYQPSHSTSKPGPPRATHIHIEDNHELEKTIRSPQQQHHQTTEHARYGSTESNESGFGTTTGESSSEPEVGAPANAYEAQHEHAEADDTRVELQGASDTDSDSSGFTQPDLEQTLDAHNLTQTSHASSHHNRPLSTDLARKRSRKIKHKKAHSRVFSPTHKEDLANAPKIPEYTPNITPFKPKERVKSSIEVAREIALGAQSPTTNSAKRARAHPSARSSPKPWRTMRGVGVTGQSWPMISNVTPSDRDVLKGLKGAIDHAALEKQAELLRIEERRRAIAESRSSPAPSTPLQYGASFQAWLAENSQLRQNVNKHTKESDLEKVRAYAEFLKQHPTVPFVSPKSQELAANRAAAKSIHQRLHGDSSTWISRREQRRRERLAAEEEAAKAAMFHVTGKSKEIIEEMQLASRSGSSSAALRMYDHGQSQAREREQKQAKLAEMYKTEKQKDDEANCTFHPKLNHLAQCVVNTEPIWSRAREKQVWQKKKDAIERELRRRQLEEEKHLTFKPQINEISNEIALAKRGPLFPPQPSTESSPGQQAIIPMNERLGFDTTPNSTGIFTPDGRLTPNYRSRSLSASRARSRTGSQSNSPTRSVRQRSSSPRFNHLVGEAASNRLYTEAKFRRQRQEQLQAAVDDVIQPFQPQVNGIDLPFTPGSLEANTRKQIRVLDWMAKTHHRGTKSVGSSPAAAAAPGPVDWLTEKRRMEKIHKEQLKQIHQQFLNRNDEFIQKKKEYMDRISSHFINTNGTYQYDPATRSYRFQPFFTPHLFTKKRGTSKDRGTSADRSARRRSLSEEKSSSQDESPSPTVSQTLPSTATRRPSTLVSKTSERLLANRAAQRTQLLFMMLDAGGTGSIDSSNISLIDDIPSETDRKIVQSIFDRLNQQHHRRSISPRPSSNNSTMATIEEKSVDSDRPLSPIATGGIIHPTGTLQLPSLSSTWRLSLEEFSKAFQEGYKTLIQREGPQASAGVKSTRSSAATSRATSGSATPRQGGGAITPRPGSANSHRGSISGLAAALSQSRDQSRERPTEAPKQPHAFLHAGSGGGGKGRASISISPSATMHDSSTTFAPSLNSTSELLAQKNHEEFLNLFTRDLHASEQAAAIGGEGTDFSVSNYLTPSDHSNSTSPASSTRHRHSVMVGGSSSSRSKLIPSPHSSTTPTAVDGGSSKKIRPRSSSMSVKPMMNGASPTTLIGLVAEHEAMKQVQTHS